MEVGDWLGVKCGACVGEWTVGMGHVTPYGSLDSESLAVSYRIRLRLRSEVLLWLGLVYVYEIHCQHLGLGFLRQLASLSGFVGPSS